VSAQAPPIAASRPRTGEVLRILAKHLTSLLLPVNALAFLWSGPHAWYVSPLFLLPIVLAYVLDDGPRVERRQPADELPAWPFDALVYLLAALQLLVVFGIARMFAQQDLFSVDMVVMVTVVGGSSGFSIITAHELIHRRKAWEQQLGRLLLCSVLQEHFFTEHLRGHHVRVGLPDDPATARFGESYRAFYRRTVPAQFRSAWRLEKRRLAGRSPVHNRIVQGLAVGWGMALAVGITGGLAATVAFVLQAFFASRLLEAVNYFEHWGLTRRGSRVRPRDSWDTHAWFTYYGLTGLSRHADHHYEPTRPFQQLRVQPDVPMLPSGYVAMVDRVMTKNDEFQKQAAEELRRCGLGPFEGGAEPPPQLAPPVAAPRVPAWLRGALLAGGTVLVATTGARLVGDSLPFDPIWMHALWNAWILLAFAGVVATAKRLEARTTPLPAWGAALSLLVVVGLASERAAALLRGLA
jgi:alkane 1-monooxygenase